MKKIEVEKLDYMIEKIIFLMFPKIVYDGDKYKKINNKITHVVFNDIGYENIEGV